MGLLQDSRLRVPLNGQIPIPAGYLQASGDRRLESVEPVSKVGEQSYQQQRQCADEHLPVPIARQSLGFGRRGGRVLRRISVGQLSVEFVGPRRRRLRSVTDWRRLYCEFLV